MSASSLPDASIRPRRDRDRTQRPGPPSWAERSGPHRAWRTSSVIPALATAQSRRNRRASRVVRFGRVPDRTAPGRWGRSPV